MNWNTGNHSYNGLQALMHGLKYLKYFPSLDSMIDNTDSLRIGYGDPQKITLAEDRWDLFKKQVKELAKSLSYVVTIQAGLKFQAIPLDDLKEEHFKNALTLEHHLLEIFSEFGLSPTDPYYWKEKGFVPEEPINT